MNRTTPHSIEAEQGVLGCILLSPVECMPICESRNKTGASAFYDPKHQVIYETMVLMAEKKEVIDVITLQNRLQERQLLESVGGIEYLAGLPDVVPSAANLNFYLNILIEKVLLRGVLSHCHEYTDAVYEHSGSPAALIESFESSALAVARVTMEERDITIKDLVKNRLTFYEQCLERGGGLLGLSTGFYDLDRMIDGLKGGDMFVLAARPSVGKTALSMNIAENVAVGQGLPVGVFSLEMSSNALVGRMICSRARVNERVMTGGAANEQEMKRIAVASAQLAKAPIYIDDTGGLTLTQMRAKGRRMAKQHGVRLFVIDYLQLLQTAKRRENRQQEITDISNGVKAMAKELDVPVIVISQLNRELERDKDRKPRVSDLRESGQIEQDADIIGMLYAVDPNQVADGAPVLQVNMLIAKQRNGPTGDVPFMMFKEFTRFENFRKI
jgi:replicative DNA helicase